MNVVETTDICQLRASDIMDCFVIFFGETELDDCLYYKIMEASGEDEAVDSIQKYVGSMIEMGSYRRIQ